MKKIFRLFFIMILTMSFGIVYAEDVTIDKIVESFNNGEVAKSYKDAGGNILATYDEDSIDVVIDIETEKYNVSYELDNTIISATLNSEDENSILTAYIFLGLIDEIGQLYGYESGELTKTVNSEQVSEYTLTEEGFEMSPVSDTVQEIKIDYSKKIPLIDFTGVYVEVEDLEKYKEYIADDGQAGTTKGDIYIYKFGYNGEYEILVGEKDELTEASYQSILSMIEVMFDERAVKYFKENYPSISEDKSFDGFEIKINYTDPEDSDVTYLEENGYKVIKIFVNKELVLENIKDMEMSVGSTTEDAKTEEEKEETVQEEASIVKKENTIQTILKKYGLYIGIGAGILVLLIIIIAFAGKKKKTVTAVDNYETVNISMSDMGKVIRPAVFNNTEPVQSTNQPVVQPMQQQVQQPQMQQPMNNGMQQGQMPMNNMAMNQQQMQMQQAMMQQQAMAQQQVNQGQPMNNMQNQNMNNYPNNNGNNYYNGQ